MTLDIEALAEYGGQGVCRVVSLWGDTVSRYKEVLKTWARSRNWRVAWELPEGLGLTLVCCQKCQMTQDLITGLLSMPDSCSGKL